MGGIFHIVGFSIGGKDYAVDVNSVKMITKVKNVRITQYENLPQYVIGIGDIEREENVFIVIDLEKVFSKDFEEIKKKVEELKNEEKKNEKSEEIKSQEIKKEGDRRKVIILKNNIAFIVDDITGIKTFLPQEYSIQKFDIFGFSYNILFSKMEDKKYIVFDTNFFKMEIKNL